MADSPGPRGPHDDRRLIEWTGERMVPWTDDVQVVYEHLLRYWFAATVVAGRRRILDLGCGEGYGSAILAAAGGHVVGLDIDPPTIEHATRAHGSPDVEFVVGSALDLARFAQDEFDAVVCFEVIEHLAEQDVLMGEIGRVLAPGGLLVCSTPDRDVYSAPGTADNPFHERELDRDEFAALLSGRFAHRRLWGQRTVTGAVLHPLDPDPADRSGDTVFVELAGDEWRRGEPAAPMYLVAVASDAPLPEMPGAWALADAQMSLVRNVERRLLEVRDALTAQVDAQAAQLDAQTAQLRTQAGHVARLDEALEAERARVVELDEHGRALDVELARVAGRLGGIESSLSWRALQRARYSGPGRLARSALARRRVHAGEAPGAPAAEAIRFPAVADPVASIVIPVHGHADVTLRCLKVLAANTQGVPYEVIVVDDASPAADAEALAAVGGITLLRNEENLGFLRTSNRGAAAARGEFVVFLNNDTMPGTGWLQAMVDTARADPAIGAVGAKLLQTDLSVQEAGAIVFADGTPWHVGRDAASNRPDIDYVREVDYSSAACLLIRRDLLEEIGGFDERYVPAYYEDVDLCFEVRAHGRKVVYSPEALVIHDEGTSHGTDVTTGVKAYQVRNASIFAEKWSEALAAQPPLDTEAVYAAMDHRHPHVLVIDHHIPLLDDAGSLRMREMLLALAEIGARVSFLPDNHAGLEPYTRELQRAGIEVIHGPMDDRTVLVGLKDSLDVVLISRPTIASRHIHLVREIVPDARIVYDTVDLHFVRERRRAELEDDPSIARVADAFRHIELGLVHTAHATITVSEEEREVLVAEVPGADVRVLPTLNEVTADPPGPVARCGVVFVGNFHHLPNVGAARRLAASILPLARAELPELTATIVGPYAPDDVLELAALPGVEVTGFVEDLAPVLDGARALVAPLAFGAGVKGKITQSLAAGLPVVTTTVGAEGLGGVSGRDLFVADDDVALAAAIVALHRDDALWTAMSQAGLRLAAERFSPAVARTVLADLLGSFGLYPG